MVATPATLTALMTGFNQSFEKGKSQAASQYSKIATVIKSTSKSNTYGWLGKWPKFRKWIGDRVINDMTASSYAVINKPFESSIGVDRDDIEDDEIVYAPMFKMTVPLKSSLTNCCSRCLMRAPVACVTTGKTSLNTGTRCTPITMVQAL